MSLSVRPPSRSLTQQPNFSFGDQQNPDDRVILTTIDTSEGVASISLRGSGYDTSHETQRPSALSGPPGLYLLTPTSPRRPQNPNNEPISTFILRHVPHLNSPPPSTSFRFTSPLPLGSGLLCPSPSVHPIIYMILNVAGMPSFASSPCNCL